MKTRLKILLGVAGVAIVALATGYAQTWRFEKELDAIAHAKMKEVGNYWEGAPVHVTSSVTATLPYIVAGSPEGKISVFVRPEKGGDITGFDYFLSRDDGNWKEVESARCSGAECQASGFNAFEKKHFTVAEL